MFCHPGKLQYTARFDMLSFLIARDTMHQQQWLAVRLAVREDLGGLSANLPIPDATPTGHENTRHSSYFLNTSVDEATPQGPWTSGPPLDGRAQFSARDEAEPEGQVPGLGKARKNFGAQKAQIG